MFDNLNNKAKPNMKPENEAEDIFAKMDSPRRPQGGNSPLSSLKREEFIPKTQEASPSFQGEGGFSTVQTKVMDIPSAPRPFLGKQHRGNAIKWIIVALVIIAFAVLVGFIGWKLYSRYVKQPTQNTVEKNIENSRGAEKAQPVGGEEGSQESVPAPSPQKEIDRDGDGLTDEAEARLKTNPLDVDSDNDGLFDNEEVVIYKSDPLNKDSDGDTYLDGEEVTNGYDPNGSGKLFELPTN